MTSSFMGIISYYSILVSTFIRHSNIVSLHRRKVINHEDINIEIKEFTKLFHDLYSRIRNLQIHIQESYRMQRKMSKYEMMPFFVNLTNKYQLNDYRLSFTLTTVYFVKNFFSAIHSCRNMAQVTNMRILNT